MDRGLGSRLEMAARALEFCQAIQSEYAGYTAAVAELAELLARSQQLEDLHRQGIAEVRAATARKRKLRRSIRQAQMKHVGQAAQRAAREVPELDGEACAGAGADPGVPCVPESRARP